MPCSLYSAIICKEYEQSFQLYDEHTYPGGAYRLHMLRYILTPLPFTFAIHVCVFIS